MNVEQLTGLSDPASEARDALLTRIERVGRAGRRQAARREEQAAEDGAEPLVPA